MTLIIIPPKAHSSSGHGCPQPPGEQPAAQREEVILQVRAELGPLLGGVLTALPSVHPAALALWKVQDKLRARQREAQGKCFVSVFLALVCHPALAVVVCKLQNC